MLNIFNKNNKKFTSLISLFLIASFICACSNSSSGPSSQNSAKNNAHLDEYIENEGLEKKKIAVVYFSAYDDIDLVAEEIASKLDADLLSLEPTIPYEESDFIEGNENSRRLLEARFNPLAEETEEMINEYPASYGIEETVATIVSEPAKATELPEIKRLNVNKYDIIFVGYPIWYNDAPKVIYTFLKDLKNKTIIPFTTSKDGTLATTEDNLINFVDESVDIMSGLQFSGTATESEINNWVELIDINV